MDERQHIPQYRGKTHHTHQKDVVAKELHRMDKELKAARKKNDQLEKRCNKQKNKRKAAERALSKERSEAATRALKIRIQTKLDDWNFYNDGNDKSGGDPQ